MLFFSCVPFSPPSLSLPPFVLHRLEKKNLKKKEEIIIFLFFFCFLLTINLCTKHSCKLIKWIRSICIDYLFFCLEINIMSRLFLFDKLLLCQLEILMLYMDVYVCMYVHFFLYFFL
uniref:SJCHGC08847 protein n=1 Tax=Schistosoma japonicum TaxID=6182 RepID=Q5DE94_SCHJA|nr:SJCHGC08847 protein [Schistosoma japonicum]